MNAPMHLVLNYTGEEGDGLFICQYPQDDHVYVQVESATLRRIASIRIPVDILRSALDNITVEEQTTDHGHPDHPSHHP